MSIVTFTSGVHLGVQDGSPISQAWFGASPTTEFTEFSVDVSDVQVLTSVEGRVGDGDPVLLQFGGGGLPSAYDALASVAARGVLNGEPRTTLSGYRDVVIRSGRLLRVSLRLEWDSEARTDWGVLTGVRNSVRGGQRAWSVSAVFHPCSLVYLVGRDNVSIAPDAYAALDSGGS